MVVGTLIQKQCVESLQIAVTEELVSRQLIFIVVDSLRSRK